MASSRIRSIDGSVASTKHMEAVVADVGRVQRDTKEACHVKVMAELGERLKVDFHLA